MIRRLLRIFANHHRPTRVQRRIEIVVPAMDIQSVLRQRARADFQNHRREFPWRVVILLHRVHDALAGGEVHGPASRDRISSRATLRRMFAFAFDGDFLRAENIQLTLRERLLVDFPAFSRRRDRIKDAAFSDARLDILSDELIAVASHPNARIFRDASSGLAFGPCLRLGHS
jgi:hypothetical protein